VVINVIKMNPGGGSGEPTPEHLPASQLDVSSSSDLPAATVTAPIQEQAAAAAPGQIIILQPGSRHLRLGRASDSAPRTVLHAIARRRTKTAVADPALHRRDPFIVPSLKLDPVRHRVLEECRRKCAQTLQNSLKSDGRRRFVESHQRVSQANLEKRPHKVAKIQPQPIEAGKLEDCLFGQDLVQLPSDAPYNVHFPIQRGEINLNGAVSGSQTAILSDLECIWRHAIETELGIAPTDFGLYRVVLVIPAVYQRSLIKHYVTILLLKMGFGHAFVTQDHVAAAFGAGLSHCCVVDVGDQKTSISCIEDGISLPQTRIHLDFGGSDVTQVFFYLLRQSNFPFRDCDPARDSEDAETLERLKMDNCHMNLDICGTADKSFVVSKHGYKIKYSVCLSDECLMAPLAFFHTELFDLTQQPSRSSKAVNGPSHQSRMRYMEKNEGDPEDPHDDRYPILDVAASRRFAKTGDTSFLDDSLVQSEDASQNPDSEGDFPGGISVTDTTNSSPSAVATLAAAAAASATTVAAAASSLLQQQQQPSSGSGGGLLALDSAILKSVESCPNDDLKKRVLSSILIVGAGLKFQGAGGYLKQRLALQLPSTLYRGPADNLEVVTDAKDLGSESTTWKGAAVMATLQSAQELWINPKEWTKHGQKLLREKSPFPWT